MFKILETVNNFVWGVPALFMILGVGMTLTVKTKFLQFRLFPSALKFFFSQFHRRKNEKSEMSPYRALCTALAATVGTGNLAGVAGAIALGGPGAIFWMWVSGFVGMITKFAEIVISLHYRYLTDSGEYIGGPMITIVRGLGSKWHILACFYAFFGIVASFGIGNASQINAVMTSVEEALSMFGHQFNIAFRMSLAFVIALLLFILLKGGAGKVGMAAERIVPFAAGGYILLCIFALAIKHNAIPGALNSIIQGAFCPKAVTGGMVGSCYTALRVGAARGVFTNEAGMGTAAIVHASSNCKQPIHQGLLGIVEVFIDTIVICTLTALVILCSDATVPYGTDVGMQLTSQAFTSVYGKWITVPIAASLVGFALATILGWSLYGLRCAQFLFGDRVLNSYVFIQALVVVIGAALKTRTVWLVSEILNGLMATPNLLSLSVLMQKLLRMLQKYEKSGTDLRSQTVSIE